MSALRRPAMLKLLTACVCCCIGLFTLGGAGAQPEPKKSGPAKKKQDKAKEIAGTAEYLRSVPKHFAVLRAVDGARREVTLQIEVDKPAKVWTLVPDAEIKV